MSFRPIVSVCNQALSLPVPFFFLPRLRAPGRPPEFCMLSIVLGQWESCGVVGTVLLLAGRSPTEWAGRGRMAGVIVDAVISGGVGRVEVDGLICAWKGLGRNGPSNIFLRL